MVDRMRIKLAGLSICSAAGSAKSAVRVMRPNASVNPPSPDAHPRGILLPAACERTYKSNMDSREMARKRWQGVSRKKRSDAMRKLALKRWRPRKIPGEAAPDELEKLLRLRFPPEKRAAQIARAFAALNQPPSIRLSKEEWKRIVEADVEDQY